MISLISRDCYPGLKIHELCLNNLSLLTRNTSLTVMRNIKTEINFVVFSVSLLCGCVVVVYPLP